MRRHLTFGIVLLVAIGALLIAAAARQPKPPSPTTQAIWQESGVPVETAQVSQGDMEETLQVTGDLDALNKAAISPKVSGRLVSVSAREGGAVAAGQVLAILDQGDAADAVQTAQASLASAQARLAQAVTTADVTRIQTQSAIAQAKANLASMQAKLSVAEKPKRSQERRVAEHKAASTKANLDKAEADYDRNERLLKRGAISDSSFDTVKAQYLVAQADYQSAAEELAMIDEGGRHEDVTSAESQVDSARAALRQTQAEAAQTRVKDREVEAARATVAQAQASLATARRQLADTYLRSPLDGIVSSREADPGEMVSVGQVVARVVDLKSVYLKGDLPEQELGRVRKGQTVSLRIEALPGRLLRGTVSELYPSGSTTNRNFSVRVSVPSAGGTVRPGMSASGVIVTGRQRQAILVPKDAVDDQEGTQSVYVVGPDGVAKRHLVSVVRTDARYAQVNSASGLRVGDNVVTQGRKNLRDGAKVELSGGKGSAHVAH